MEYKVHDQLDPLFETASLLLLCAQGDPRFVREETIRHLSEFGLDGEAFYSRNGLRQILPGLRAESKAGTGG